MELGFLQKNREKGRRLEEDSGEQVRSKKQAKGDTWACFSSKFSCGKFPSPRKCVCFRAGSENGLFGYLYMKAALISDPGSNAVVGIFTGFAIQKEGLCLTFQSKVISQRSFVSRRERFCSFRSKIGTDSKVNAEIFKKGSGIRRFRTDYFREY